ncbi:MAG TPA: hypothetical protein VKK61_02245 [Tepidisphaeraceae bacterium]|nr:hypothetical protein [Tepidisphaeraceae bacterium]
MSEDQFQLLTQARDRAERLVGELRTQFDEIEENPPTIPREQLLEGQAAMQKAIAAAQRSLAALNDAMDIARSLLPDEKNS